MRLNRVVLAAVLTTCLAPIVSACCITVTWRGVDFVTHSTAVGYARWDDHGYFVVESAIRGDWKANDTVAYEPRQCDFLQPAKLYLISRICSHEECRIAPVAERDFPRLLDYMRNEHDETQESIRAEAVAWLNGSLSLADFREWVKYAGVKPRSDVEDEFARSLIIEFDGLGFEMSWIPKGASIDAQLLRDLERWAREFPAARPEEFDAKFSDDDDSPRWDDYAGQLEDAITKTRTAARALMPKWQ